ncbi:MAG TPA: DUF2027 domain-containing protein [Bacteroidia bacterium]|jgi:hypothetical protein|nr:DUF2027 domain-containing protein [Bacteroidia bacterium]
MNFKLGDKVKFLNEKGEGIITRIINVATVGVTVEDGFEIPFAISNLIVMSDKMEEKPSVPKVKVPPMLVQEKQPQSKQAEKVDEEEGVYLGFSPENKKDISHSNINVWLMNHTSYTISFSYSIWNAGTYNTLETGKIEAFDVDLVQTINRKELNDHRNFKIDVLFYSEKAHEHQPPVSNVIKLKPIKLYKENAFRSNGFIKEGALIFPVYKVSEGEMPEAYRITNQKLSGILFQKNKESFRSKISKPHATNDPLKEMEIDLHIEELLDDYSNMSNAEIIQVQLRHFQNALDKATNEHLKKLIVIHGVGNGRLKQEVRLILAGYSNLKYYDGSYARYGFGATEIQFY